MSTCSPRGRTQLRAANRRRGRSIVQRRRRRPRGPLRADRPAAALKSAKASPRTVAVALAETPLAHREGDLRAIARMPDDEQRALIRSMRSPRRAAPDPARGANARRGAGRPPTRRRRHPPVSTPSSAPGTAPTTPTGKASATGSRNRQRGHRNDSHPLPKKARFGIPAIPDGDHAPHAVPTYNTPVFHHFRRAAMTPQPAECRRAAIYARYSSDLQNPRSIDDQIHICRARGARPRGHRHRNLPRSARTGTTMRNRTRAQEHDDRRQGAPLRRRHRRGPGQDQPRPGGHMSRLQTPPLPRHRPHHPSRTAKITAMHVGLRGLMNEAYITKHGR